MDGIIEQIKQNLDLVERMRSAGAELSKNGSGYVGWHKNAHESTSKNGLRVSADGAQWNCFSCEQGGDLLTWIGHECFGDSYSDKDSGMFSEVLRVAADAAGVQLEQVDPAIVEERRNVESLMEIAANFYHNSLTPHYREFIKNTYGLTDNTIDELKLGFSPAQKNALIKHYQEQGISDADIASTGLVLKFDKGGMTDLFQGRITMPYWKGGRVCYFTSRKTDSTPDKPWETSKYKKQMVHSTKNPYVSQQISNEYFYAEDATRGADYIVITEGVTDCIIANQESIPCISPATVQFRKADWPRLLQITRHVNTIYIANDNEENAAGDGGAMATAQMFWENGKHVKMLELPRPDGVDKVDLNDLIREHGAEAFTDIFPYGKTLLDIRVAEAQAAEGEEKDKALREVFKLLAWIDDTFLLTRHRNSLPKELGITKADYDVLSASMVRQQEKSAPSTFESIVSDEPETWPYEVHQNQLCHLSYRENEHGDRVLTRKPIARFTVYISEESTMEDGRKIYIMDGLSLHGGAFRVEVDAETFSDTKKLKAIVEAAAGVHDPVIVSMEKHLGNSIKYTSPLNVLRTKRFNRTGWNNGVFLAPGRERKGTTIVLPQEVPMHISAESNITNALIGFNLLTELVDKKYSTILLAGVLGPPMARLAGWGTRRYAIFCKGQTGAFKTSTVLAYMSIWGEGYLSEDNIIAWGEKATANAIMKIASHSHDMPFLIDNYKPNTGRGPEAFISMIHNIMEGSERKRLDRSANLRESASLDCWPMCTGEDVPVADAATLARILVIPFEKRTTASFEPLSQVQALGGEMNAIGRVWLDWLESEDGRSVAEEVGKELDATRSQWAAKLYALRPDMANVHRVASTLAINELTLLAVSQHPVLGEIISPLLEEHRAGLHEMAEVMSGYTADSLEANRYLSAVRELVGTGRCVLPSTSMLDSAISADRDRIIGWQDDDYVYLLPAVTKTAIERLAGDRLGDMTNRTIYAQLDSLGGIGRSGKDQVPVVKKIQGKSQRVLCIKKSFLFDEE